MCSFTFPASEKHSKRILFPVFRQAAAAPTPFEGLGSFPLAEFGTEEQKQKYLVPLLKGEKLGAFAVTEPSAGSDLGNQQTTAVDMGDYWLLNGSKIFITNGCYADTYFVTAMTDKSQRSRGISGFIVEKGTPGFTFGTKDFTISVYTV